MKYSTFIVLFGIGCASQASADERDKAAWIANAFDKINSTSNVAHWWALNDISKYSNSEKRGSVEGERAALNFYRWEAERAQKQYRTFDSGVEATFAYRVYEGVKTIPILGPNIGGFLQDRLKQEAGKVELKHWQRYNREFMQYYGNNNVDRFKILSTLYDGIQKNPQFAGVFDEVYGLQMFGVTHAATATQILQSNPTLARSPSLDTLAHPGLTPAYAKNAIKTEVNKQLSDILEEKSSKNKTNRFSSKTNDAERREAQLSALRSAVFIATYFMQDEKAARQFNAVATAIIEIAALANKRRDIQGMEQDQANQDMVNAAAAFNFFALALNVMTAFSEKDSPSPDQLLSQQIVELAKQMKAYQEENRARFDRIDATLSLMLAETMNQFGELSSKIGGVSDDLNQLRGAISQVLHRLDEIHNEFSNFLQLIADAPFDQSMTACLNYEKKTGKRMDEQIYDQCVFSIENYLSQSSSDAFSGADIADGFFNSLPAKNYQKWESSINVFLSVANRRASFNFQRRANPARWARAVDSFITLAIDNKGYFARKPKLLFDALINEGKALKYSTAEKFQADAGRFYSLLASLLKDYVGAAKDVTSAAAERRKRASSDLGASDVWLTEAQLMELTRQRLPDFQKRGVLFADKWPVLQTEGVPANKEPARGAGLPLEPLADGQRAWEMLAQFPPILGSEILGLGPLHLRYYTDVIAAEMLSDGVASSLWGEPLVTVFTYSLKPPAVIPTKPIALMHLKAGWKTIMFTECNRAPLCKYMRDYNPADRLKQFDWVEFLRAPGSWSDGEVVAAASIVPQIEVRLDELLRKQHEALDQEVNREDSDISRALLRLDTATSMIRGLMLMAKPRMIDRNDNLRAALFGIPSIDTCEFIGSRVWSRKGGTSRYLAKAVAGLGVFEGGAERLASSAPNGVASHNKCNIASQTELPKFIYLLDRNIAGMFVKSVNNIDPNLRPKYLDNNNLLIDFEKLAAEGSKQFLLNMQTEEKAAFDTDQHTLIDSDLSRLAALATIQ